MAPQHRCLHETELGAFGEFKGEVLRKVDKIDEKLDRFFDELKLKADKVDVDKLEKDIAANYIKKSSDGQDDKNITSIKNDFESIKRTMYVVSAIIGIIFALGSNVIGSWIREKLTK